MSVLLDWEVVQEMGSNGKTATQYERAKVPGGWLLRDIMLAGKAPPIFLPDDGHGWGSKSSGLSGGAVGGVPLEDVKAGP